MQWYTLAEHLRMAEGATSQCERLYGASDPRTKKAERRTKETERRLFRALRKMERERRERVVQVGNLHRGGNMEPDKSVTHYPNGAVRPEHAAPVPNNVREGVGAFAAYIALRDCRWELATLLRQTENLVTVQRNALDKATEYEQRFREVAKAEDISNFRNG